MAQYFCSHIIHKSVLHHSPLREARVGQESSRHSSLERTVKVPGVLARRGWSRSQVRRSRRAASLS